MKAIRFILVIAGAMVLGGCGSCSEAGTGGANSENGQVVVPKRDDSASPYNSNGNGNLVPYNGLANSNANGNPTLDNSKVTVVDTSNVKNTLKARKLPENSELTTIMNSKGHVVETRTFVNNEYISKVEKITVNPEDVTLNIHLKKGGVKKVPAGKIKDFRIATVYDLLTSVGITPELKNDPNAPSKEKVLREQIKKLQ